MKEEKGYVIRCHDLFDGSTDFRGIPFLHPGLERETNRFFFFL